jgi:hypothetical protein
MEVFVPDILADKTIMNQLKTHKTSLHVAFLVKRNKVIAIATNKIGSRSKASGYSECTIHAEKNVVKQLGDIGQLRGATLYVIRISKCVAKKGIDKVQNSEPCHDCHLFLEKCVKQYGLRRVFYSLSDFVELDMNARPPKKY